MPPPLDHSSTTHQSIMLLELQQLPPPTDRSALHNTFLPFGRGAFLVMRETCHMARFTSGKKSFTLEHNVSILFLQAAK